MPLPRWLLLFLTLAIVLFIAVLTLNRRPPIQACTMDAKVCPDGSTVGRVLPDCEFASCPESQTSTPPPEIQSSFDSDTSREP